MSVQILAFLGMVFAAVFLLSQGLVIPIFGEARRTRKRLRSRLKEIESTRDRPAIQSVLREKYLTELSPLERWLESLPLMENLAQVIEQAGRKMLAYRLVLAAIALSIVVAFITQSFFARPLYWIPPAVLAFTLPFLWILRLRQQRFMKFEEQFPEAIDVMKRALRAGHPFSESMRLVAEEMQDPVSREFAITFADLNYGNDVRSAMLGLLERMPSVTVMALVTSVLVQKETGGNLAEILDEIGKVIRGRFRLQRKIKTLSAEGRLSAWILAMIPFGLFAAISITTPSYLPSLLENPMGQKLIFWGFALMVVGIYWIRRIIRIDV